MKDLDTLRWLKHEKAEIENQIKIAKMVKVVPVTTADSVGVGFVALVRGLGYGNERTT